ncbi:uncharacterized protein MELLADRAFT_73042 [Melampsora larici-populina 98AG31]|uniref:Uncharacterized protein n=1 Tax=Melampsora larici-populina (strain 98AG31 / pathotype 3-4-7) TaxID=747676 RepID=F4S299_MELLP|nr:uncharacterized protein MELLADRAFT_73042 [Melampsora larici-populina 98AG31]EGG01240.1 hypothetical protein MELLADRAFT_73042 [Melampsora larici-populina 98AG31]
MIAKLYEKSKSLVVGPICVREDVIANVKHLQEARFAWLRLQAIHWGIHGDQYLGQTFWNVVDSKLEELRGKSLRYRYAYHVCILHDDFDLINGKATFKQIQSNKGNKFLMPSDARVLTCVQELNDTFGDDGPQDEAEHESIAVAVDEEEGNEEEDEGEQQED